MQKRVSQARAILERAKTSIKSENYDFVGESILDRY
jgi:hypothetical protein